MALATTHEGTYGRVLCNQTYLSSMIYVSLCALKAEGLTRETICVVVFQGVLTYKCSCNA